MGWGVIFPELASCTIYHTQQAAPFHHDDLIHTTQASDNHECCGGGGVGVDGGIGSGETFSVLLYLYHQTHTHHRLVRGW